MQFLSTFTGPFIVALWLWPLVAFILTIPAAAYLYHRDNGLRLPSVAAAYLFMLYMCGLGCFTLYPAPEHPQAFCAVHHIGMQLNPLQFIGDIRTDGTQAILQLLMNIVLFIPLGFFMKRFFSMRLWLAVPFAFCTSLLIETAQLTGIFHMYPCAYRVFDVDDMITNTLGAIIGFAIAFWFDQIVPSHRASKGEISTSPTFVRRFVCLCVDLTCIIAAWGFTLILWAMVNARIGESMRHEYPGWFFIIVYFALVEVVLPLLHHGTTLGCWYTRMTLDTVQRTPVLRITYYIVRAITLFILIFGFFRYMHISFLSLDALVLLYVCVTKSMPYDYIGQKKSVTR